MDFTVSCSGGYPLDRKVKNGCILSLECSIKDVVCKYLLP